MILKHSNEIYLNLNNHRLLPTTSNYRNNKQALTCTCTNAVLTIPERNQNARTETTTGYQTGLGEYSPSSETRGLVKYTPCSENTGLGKYLPCSETTRS